MGKSNDSAADHDPGDEDPTERVKRALLEVLEDEPAKRTLLEVLALIDELPKYEPPTSPATLEGWPWWLTSTEVG